MTLIRGKREGPPVSFAAPADVPETAPTLAPDTGGGFEVVPPPRNSLIRGEREGAPVSFTGPPPSQGFSLPSVAEFGGAVAPDVSGLTPESDPLGEAAFLSTPVEGTEFSASQASEQAGLGGRLNLMLADLFVSDPQQVAAIIEENDPGATITRNERGEATAVTVDGRTMPLNKPGISGRDIGAMIGPTAAFIATRGLGSALVGGATRGFLANTGLSAAAGGGEALIRRGVEAGVGGREFTEDLGQDVAFGAVTGGGGEVLGRGLSAGIRTALALPGIRDLLRRGVRITTPDGQLNETGRTIVRQAGADPATVTPTMARSIQAEVDKLAPQFALGATPVPPTTAAGIRQAAPTNVAVNRAFAQATEIPATTGGLSGVEKQLGREFNAQGRTFSGAPLRGRQIQAEEGLARITQARAGVNVTAAEQAATIGQSVRAAGEKARAAAGGVYESIKNRIKSGTRLDLGTGNLKTEIIDPLGKQGFPDIDFAGLPKANAARKFLRDFARRHARKPDVAFADVEAARRSINAKWIKNTRDPAELHALSRVVDTLDNWVEGVRSSNNFTGEASLLADTLRARSLWTQFKQTFASRTAGETVVRDLARGSTTDIGGLNKFFSPSTGPAAVRQLERATGRNSEAMQTLRQSAWRRLLATSGGETKSIAQASKAVSKAVNEEAEVFRAAMGPAEFTRLRRLEVALKNAVRQPKVKQKTNPVSDTIRQILSGLALGRATSVAGGTAAGAVPGAVAGGALLGSGAAMTGAIAVPAAVLATRTGRNILSASGRGTPARGLLETPAAALIQQGLLGAGGR